MSYTSTGQPSTQHALIEVTLDVFVTHHRCRIGNVPHQPGAAPEAYPTVGGLVSGYNADYSTDHQARLPVGQNRRLLHCNGSAIWAPVILKVRFLNQTSQNLFGIIARFEGLHDISKLLFVQKMILFKYIRDFPFPVQSQENNQKARVQSRSKIGPARCIHRSGHLFL